jgi:hypothetical protein
MVDKEYAISVESLLTEREYEKKVKDGWVQFSLKQRDIEVGPFGRWPCFYKTRGEYLDFLWSLYAIDSGFE